MRKKKMLGGVEANVAKSAVTGQDERENQRARSRRRLEMKVGMYRRWGTENKLSQGAWGGRGEIEVKRYQQGGEFLSGREVYVGWGENEGEGQVTYGTSTLQERGRPKEKAEEAKQQRTKKKKRVNKREGEDNNRGNKPRQSAWWEIKWSRTTRNG
jgi:hypothetical protein